MPGRNLARIILRFGWVVLGAGTWLRGKPDESSMSGSSSSSCSMRAWVMISVLWARG